MKTQRTRLAFAALLVFSFLPIAALSITQTATVNGKSETETLEQIHSTDNGIRKVETIGKAQRSVSFVDSSGACVREEVKTEKGEYVMTSDGKNLTVSGTWDGKSINRTVPLNGKAFYGSGFTWSVKALLASGKKSMKFWMFNALEPDKPVEMEYKIQGDETVNGRKAKKIKIGLTGLMAAFWSATIWTDNEQRTIRYQGNSGPGTPEMTIDTAYQ